MWRLRCLGSRPSAGLTPSACGFWTSKRCVRTEQLRACWWAGWMAPSAGCRSQCKKWSWMWRALISPTATGRKVRRLLYTLFITHLTGWHVIQEIKLHTFYVNTGRDIMFTNITAVEVSLFNLLCITLWLFSPTIPITRWCVWMGTFLLYFMFGFSFFKNWAYVPIFQELDKWRCKQIKNAYQHQHLSIHTTLMNSWLHLQKHNSGINLLTPGSKANMYFSTMSAYWF